MTLEQQLRAYILIHKHETEERECVCVIGESVGFFNLKTYS